MNHITSACSRAIQLATRVVRPRMRNVMGKWTFFENYLSPRAIDKDESFVKDLYDRRPFGQALLNSAMVTVRSDPY